MGGFETPALRFVADSLQREMDMSTGSDDPQINEAYDRWWSDVSRRGDPARRPNLSSEAFVAGYKAALADVLRSRSMPRAWQIFGPGDRECARSGKGRQT